MEAGGVGAPYGRACTNCAKAKCKCMFGSDGDDSCLRCDRLGKECERSISTRKRGKRSASSRTAQLEKKLDGIVSMLQQGMPVVSTEGLSSATRSAEPSSAPAGDNNPSVTSEDPSELSFEDAEACLCGFREKLTYFPYLYLPSSTTSEDLKRERPFLWRCIVSINVRSTAKQWAIGGTIRKELGQRMIEAFDKSLELLLGIVTYVGWIHFHLQHKTCMTLMHQLMCSLIYDMDLNRGFHEEPRNVFTFHHDGRERSYGKNQLWRSDGQFWRVGYSVRAIRPSCVDSSLSDGMTTWTNASKYFRRLKECPGDATLIHQARLQHISEEGFRLQLNLEISQGMGFRGDTTDIYVSALLARVQEEERRVQSDPQAHLIYEVELSKSHRVEPSLERVERLQGAVSSLRTWLELYQTIPAEQMIHVSFAAQVHVVHCLMTLYALTMLKDPLWDRQALRNTIDVLQMFDWISQGFGRTPHAAGFSPSECAESVFTRTTKVLDAVRQKWEANLAASQEVFPQDVACPTATIHVDQIPGIGLENVDIFADDWLMNWMTTTQRW